MSRPDTTPARVIALAFAVGAVCFGVAMCSGCGASTAVRGAYALEQARCIANERDIIERVSTEEEDTRDMAAERARCDAALAAIERSE